MSFFTTYEIVKISDNHIELKRPFILDGMINEYVTLVGKNFRDESFPDDYNSYFKVDINIKGDNTIYKIGDSYTHQAGSCLDNVQKATQYLETVKITLCSTQSCETKVIIDAASNLRGQTALCSVCEEINRAEFFATRQFL